MKTADFRKKMPVKKYFPIKEYKQFSLLGKNEPDRKNPSYKHYKLVFVIRHYKYYRMICTMLGRSAKI